jgi:hypothetical protein
MPVNASVHQPMGTARQTSVALAVGSAASQFFINAKNKKYVELKYRQII